MQRQPQIIVAIASFQSLIRKIENYFIMSARGERRKNVTFFDASNISSAISINLRHRNVNKKASLNDGEFAYPHRSDGLVPGERESLQTA
jgi:hypothetical protein